MAQCKYCGRSGWFLSLSREGLCRNCGPTIVRDVVRKGQIINESLKIIKGSRKLETQLSRCDLVIDLAQTLTEYDKRGINTIQPPPSYLLRDLGAQRDELILAGLEREASEAQAKAQVATSIRAKLTFLSKVLLRIREWKLKASRPDLLDALEKTVAAVVHQAQLDGHLEEARKAEFKGQRKKALDHYYEALYFLKHDDIEDSLQGEHISRIEAKIAELGGASTP